MTTGLTLTKPWIPDIPVSHIQSKWDLLEETEHNRELNLHEQLKRQERLNALASNFQKKAQMREDWLRESTKLLETDNFGSDLAAVEAAQKVANLSNLISCNQKQEGLGTSD